MSHDEEAIKRLAEERLARQQFDTTLGKDRLASEMVQELSIYRAELESQNQSLQESNSELQRLLTNYYLLFDAAPVPFFLLDVRGYIIKLNLRAAEILESSRSQLINQPLLRFLHPRCRGEFLTFYQRTAKAPEGERQRHQVELGKSYQARHVELEALNITEDSERRILMLFKDITTLKETQQRLELALEESRRSNALKTRFLAHVSHEIRTPISAILGYAELLRREISTDSMTSKLDIIEQAGSNLLLLINDILDISRIESNHLALDVRPFSLKALIEHLDSLLRLRAHRKSIHFDVRIHPSLPESVEGDQERLQQVISNLLDNALKFTPPEGRVALRVHYQAGRVIFAIEDSGPGIPEEKHEVIFDAFEQVDVSDSRAFGGAGLGLAIAKELVNKMRGHIYVRSHESGGTVFTVQVPLKRIDMPINPTPIVAASAKSSAEQPLEPQDFQGRRLLIIEDDRDLRDLLSLFAQNVDIEYDTAPNGLEGLKCLEKTNYDLVLLDIQMPVMDGYETIQRIREADNLTGLIVYALTAHAFESERQRCLSAGCNGYLTKPITFNTFMQTLSDVLGSNNKDETQGEDPAETTL